MSTDFKLGKYLPRWVLAKISKRTCFSCGFKFNKCDIVQVGIRKTKNPDGTTQASLAVETWCSNCKKGSITTFPQEHYKSFRHLLCLLLSEIQKNDRAEAAQKRAKELNDSFPQITEKDLEDFKKELEKMTTHSEFLNKLGLSDD